MYITYSETGGVEEFQNSTVDLTAKLGRRYKEVKGHGKYRVFSNGEYRNGRGIVTVFYGGFGGN